MDYAKESLRLHKEWKGKLEVVTRVPVANKEETNLLSIYKTGSRQGLIVAMNAALPFIDGEMRGFAARTLAKVERMSEAEFAELPIYAADEV